MNAGNWIAFAAVLVALVGAGVTLYISRHRKPKMHSVVQGPRLNIQEIHTPPGTLNQTPPTIDVRLLNSGTGTALIVGCDIEVVWAHRFKDVQPPTVTDFHSHAAMLPPSAQYVVLLPDPEEAYGKSFNSEKAEPHPLEAIRGSDGLNLSHELKPGEVDRFIVRIEVKSHGGGTLFDHAMPGDDRMVYQVRLLIRYAGGRKVQTLTTSKVSIASPANQIYLPAQGQVRELIDKFRSEVKRTEEEANESLVRAGVEPLDWAYVRSSKKDLGVLQKAFPRMWLSLDFLYPDNAIRNFLDNLENFCRTILDKMPPGSDLAQVYFPAARRTLAEVDRVRDEELS